MSPSFSGTTVPSGEDRWRVGTIGAALADAVWWLLAGPLVLTVAMLTARRALGLTDGWDAVAPPLVFAVTFTRVATLRVFVSEAGVHVARGHFLVPWSRVTFRNVRHRWAPQISYVAFECVDQLGRFVVCAQTGMLGVDLDALRLLLRHQSATQPAPPHADLPPLDPLRVRSGVARLQFALAACAVSSWIAWVPAHSLPDGVAIGYLIGAGVLGLALLRVRADTSASIRLPRSASTSVIPRTHLFLTRPAGECLPALLISAK